ncbi:MAG TPA: thiamine phosphate synthase [Candidatus Dormibacteraeota bacterium]|nr:thiamine phosphate synthase [Candidatus Dormibacteraeota bacterium]
MAVVDGSSAGERAVGNGATHLLLRMPQASVRSFHRALVELLQTAGVPVLVSDRVDLALAVGAAGVNLPEAGLGAREARVLLGPGPLLGRSVHSVEGVASAAAQGADFVLLGPIFPTPTHPATPGLGLQLLQRAVAAAPIPVLAIGGVDRERAARCLAAGAAGYAGIRIFESGDLR